MSFLSMSGMDFTLALGLTFFRLTLPSFKGCVQKFPLRFIDFILML